MKKTAAIILIICALLVSCGTAREYVPMIVLPTGFSMSENTITANLVNVYFFAPYEEIHCENGSMILYDDAAHTNVFEGGEIELIDGENTFFIVFEGDGGEKEYKIVINCDMILDFSVEALYDREYYVGDEFDRGSVRVTAKKENGEFVEVSNYAAEYDFTKVGTRRIGIHYGGIVHFIYVTVK